MAKRRKRSIQVAGGASNILGGIDWRALGSDPLGELQVFAGASTPLELQARLDEQLRMEVSAILAATRDCDAFDLVELLRLREIPIAPVLAVVSDHDGSAAAIDLVVLVLLSGRSRMPSNKERDETAPHTVIPDLHNRATRLLRLATYKLMWQASTFSKDPLARLAAEYQAHRVSVRALQYESVQSAIDLTLFGRPEIQDLLSAKLGFSYNDFLAVRDAIRDQYSRIMNSLRDVTGDVFMQIQNEGREPTVEEQETLTQSMVQLMFLPGQRASFNAVDISTESGLELATVEAVLDAFSIGFNDEQGAVDAVRKFLRGDNPLAKTCLICDSSGQRIMTGSQIGTDSFRSLAEAAFKHDAKAWRRYDRSRTEVSEALATEALQRILQTSATHTNLKYTAPKKGVDPRTLNADCVAPAESGDQTEADGLFVIEDVAICLEVKGRTIADSARRGDLARLRTEVENVLGTGASQARRLENLIRVNGGVWLDTGEWLDLSGIRETRTVVVGLDDFGPLGVALGDLERANVLGTGTIPWITSLHDLDVISKVIDRPAEFLLYLRRRTDSGVAVYHRGSDELDLFMLFLDGGLYVEPDPEEVRRQHPKSPPPRSRDHREHEADALPTRVGTHTDPLDAWMYWVEGSSPYEIEKPTYNIHESVREIVDFLAEGRKPGWFRFGADLLGLDGRSQKKLGDYLRELVKRTRADGRGHHLVEAYAGLWGYPTFFAASKPSNQPHGEAASQLRTYMSAKKHQVQSDRSLGLLLDDDRNIVQVIYMNEVPTEDASLDELGRNLGLVPPDEPIRPVPPSAKRRTHRLRGSSRKKKRKG